MCTANLDIYTHFWTDTFSHPFPDFSIEHKCRDFDAILDWQRKHGVRLEDFVSLTKPDDYGPARKMSHEFKRIHDWYNEHADNGNDDDGEDG